MLTKAGLSFHSPISDRHSLASRIAYPVSQAMHYVLVELMVENQEAFRAFHTSFPNSLLPLWKPITDIRYPGMRRWSPIIFLVFLISSTVQAYTAMTFCKCVCFTNSTILPLYLPKDPVHPCLTCTRQFCLDQKLPICLGAKTGDEDLDTGTGKSGDVEARCFRE
jgi:hypothetical protein